MCYSVLWLLEWKAKYKAGSLKSSSVGRKYFGIMSLVPPQIEEEEGLKTEIIRVFQACYGGRGGGIKAGEIIAPARCA